MKSPEQNFYKKVAQQLETLLKDSQVLHQAVEAEVEELESGPDTPALEARTRDLERLESLQEILSEALACCEADD